jgi:hypothetical protein
MQKQQHRWTKKGQNSAESILDMDTPWNQALTSGLQVYIHILER